MKYAPGASRLEFMIMDPISIWKYMRYVYTSYMYIQIMFEIERIDNFEVIWGEMECSGRFS